MSSIKLTFDVNDADLRSRFFTEILPRIIDSLEEHEEPDWGKMSVHHMVEHLIFAFQISTGKIDVDCYTPEEKRSKLQSFLNVNRPMPKGFVNPVAGTGLMDLQYSSLDMAKDVLKEEIQFFLDYYERSPHVSHINPIFGELKAEQWEKFHFKHCFHHLSQFGLIVSND